MDPVSKAQAENKQESSKYPNRIDRVKGHRWQKGQSGNPSGRPKKLHITKMYEQILNKSSNRKEIVESLMKILTGGRMASVLMIREMAERTEGKVDQNFSVNGEINLSISEVIAERRKRANE